MGGVAIRNRFLRLFGCAKAALGRALARLLLVGRERGVGLYSSERMLRLARARRDELLKSEKWIDSSAVHAQQGGRPNFQNVHGTATALRREGKLLGAWSGREFLHPAFQFRTDTGRLMPEMQSLLAILPTDRTGWGPMFWVFQPHGQLGGSRPADIFPLDPGAVLAAAHSDFELTDERW